MKIAFNSLLIVAACAAIFFSFSLSSKFKAEQGERLNAISEDQDVTSRAEATEKNLADTQDSLKEAQDQEQMLAQTIATLKATEKTLKRDMAEAESTIVSQKEQLATVEQTIQQLKESLKDIGSGVTMENLGDKIADIEAGNTQKQAKLEELATNAESTEKRIAAAKAESDRLTQKDMERKGRIARNATEAVVTAVNQDWGFLVIGAGTNSGFNPQSRLLVKRDGRLIGRVQPSSVEATQTVADIDMDSISPGVRIQPGDQVILATPASK